MNDRNGEQPTAGEPPIDWQAELANHDRWLRTVIAARLRDRSAVDEVMQEVSLATLAQKSPLRNRDRVAPWLYRTAVLQTLMYRRKRGRLRRLTERYARLNEHQDPTDQPYDPLDWLLFAERRQWVRRGLASLPRRDAEILLLKYTEDWSYNRIAEHLGLSHSAVEARLHRARLRLRTVLAAPNPIEMAKSP